MSEAKGILVILLALLLLRSFTLAMSTPWLSASDDSFGVSSVGAICGPSHAALVQEDTNPGDRAPAITITATEATGAVIHPEHAYYNLDRPADALTTITWNDASAVDSIVDDTGNALVEGLDYKLVSLNGTATLAVLDDYLAARLVHVGDEVQLTIGCDSYSPVVFIITAVSGEMTAQYTLTISSTPGGSVSEPGEGVLTYNAGTAVELVATADEGYSFSGWSGDVDSLAEVHDAATIIVMYASYGITAGFSAEVRERVVGPCLIAGVLAAVVAAGAAVLLVRRRRTVPIKG